MAALSPAESLFLLKPNRTPARETVKVTLLSLLAQGMVRLEEQHTRRFFGTKKTVYVRPTGKRSALPAHAGSLLHLVQGAQLDTGAMPDLVKRARERYGSNLNGFNREFIIPALISRGLLEERRVLLIPTRRRTPAGDAEESRIAADVARARRIPELLHSNPAEAAAIILAVGGTILLVNELRPYYRQISEALRSPPAADGGSDSGGGDSAMPFWDSSDKGSAHPGEPGHHLDAASLNAAGLDATGLDAAGLGALDLSAFDATAFDTLDAGMASFDGGFDSAVGDGGGGDGGGGDGGGGSD